MAVLVHARADDEIADLIAKVSAAGDPAVGLVLPQGSRALQTPLNARLLSQFGRQNGRTTAIVSDEPRVQELARQHGFPVYPSAAAFERGMQLAAAPSTPVRAFGAVTALEEAPARSALAAPVAPVSAPLPATEAPPEPVAPVAAPVAPAAPATPARPTRTRTAAVIPPIPPARGRRRLMYFGGAAVALIGLLLFFTLAPTATVTVTVAATPLSISPTIQGSTDANAAKQGDHILTSSVNATASGQFAANPSGSTTLPPTPATATLQFTTNIPQGAQFQLSQGDQFQNGDHSITFLVTKSTYICIGPKGSPPPTSQDCGGVPPNSQVNVQDATAEGKGNVGANAITYWPNDPCHTTQQSFCAGPNGKTYDIFVTNPQAAGGGADQKQVTTASAQDVSAWTAQVSQLQNQLTSQVNTAMQGKAGGGTFAVDPGGNGKSIAFTVNPQLPATGAQFSQTQITVTANAKAVVYNPADVRNDIIADLSAQVTQGDELAPGKLSIQPCSVTQASADGTVVLSCTATDLAQPIVNIPGLKAQLAGKNPGSATKIIQGAIDKVQDVQVSEFPFKLFYLPLFSSRIQIDENFVTQQPTTSP